MQPRLTPEDVEALYLRLLGRHPSRREIEIQTANSSLAALLEVIVTSEEFGNRSRELWSFDEDVLYANVWSPGLDRHGRPPGTLSESQGVLVGHAGMLFQVDSSGAQRAMSGELDAPEEWRAGWADVLEHRRREAAALAVEPLWLIVPDNWVCEHHLHPTGELPSERRPVRLLEQELGLPLHYPLDLLRGMAGGAYLRTDTHLTLEGSRAVAAVALEAVSAPPPPPLEELNVDEVLVAGDQGKHFHPHIGEVMRRASSERIEVVSDCYETMLSFGAWIGTQQVLRNPAAADPRTCVIFGDSFARAASGYQGLAWWFALAFAEVHMLWYPCGWDSGYLRDVRPDVVMVEAAESILDRIPLAEVDARALTARSLSARRPLELAEVHR